MNSAYKEIAETASALLNEFYALDELKITINLQDGGILKYKFNNTYMVNGLNNIIAICQSRLDNEA